MLNFVILIICVYHAWRGDSAEIPKSHIDVLDELLPKYFNDTTSYQSSITDLLFGDINATTEDTILNLDINVLDHNTLKKIIEAEKNKYENTTITRRYERKKHDAEYYDDVLTAASYQSIIARTFNMMRQSIYHARYRLMETKLLRVRFKHDYPYHLGIIVANVYQLLIKCEHIYQQMYRWTVEYKYIFFLFHLILYEKILACHTDVEDLVRRAFRFQKLYEDIEADSLENSKGGPEYDEEGNLITTTTPDPNVALTVPVTTDAPGIKPSRAGYS